MRISVITPTLNLIESGRRDTFLDAVRSVRAQTHDDIEHLVIDGASTDGTVALLEDLEHAGEIAGFRSEKDGGIYEAMNRGAARATGDYLMFLNSDDFYHRSDGLAEIASAGGADFVCSPVVILTEPPMIHKVSSRFARVLMRMPFNHPGMAVRRDVFSRMGGFDTQFRIAADYDLIVRLVAANASSAILEEAFASFRPGGISADVDARTNDRVAVLKKNFDTVLEMSQADWRAALTAERLPRRFLAALLAAPSQCWNMRVIALYHLLRTFRRGRRRKPV